MRCAGCCEVEYGVSAQVRPQYTAGSNGSATWTCGRRFMLTITEGELLDLIDEFSDGRIQFAFVKVKDPNSSLPKNVLIAWVCMVYAHYSTPY